MSKKLEAKRKFGAARALVNPAHPIVAQIFATIKASELSVEKIGSAAGCDSGAIYKWARRGPGNLAKVEAVLRVLGLRLVVEPINKARWKRVDGVWVKEV